jgi:hypothetical protein
LFSNPFITRWAHAYLSRLVELNGGPNRDYVFRDDHVARYLNAQLEPFVSAVIGAPVTSVAVSNFNWYGSGNGFGPHIDASPWFDVSLVLTLGPTGAPHRVTVITGEAGDQPRAVEISTMAGDGFLFAGSELLHFGNPFPPREAHGVAVLTYTYVRW